MPSAATRAGSWAADRIREVELERGDAARQAARTPAARLDTSSPDTYRFDRIPTRTAPHAWINLGLVHGAGRVRVVERCFRLIGPPGNGSGLERCGPDDRRDASGSHR